MPVLLAILVVFASAASSFAQVTISILPTPSPNEINTNHAAQTWDPASKGSGILISGQVSGTTVLTTTVLALTYSATIASSFPVYNATSRRPLSASAATTSRVR